MRYTVFIPEYPGAEHPDVREAWAEDLGSLAEVDGPEEYGIALDGKPWGLLSVQFGGLWSISSLDGSVLIGPGFKIV